MKITETFTANNVSFDMIYAQRKCANSGFYIGKTYVTEALWLTVMGNYPTDSERN